MHHCVDACDVHKPTLLLVNIYVHKFTLFHQHVHANIGLCDIVKTVYVLTDHEMYILYITVFNNNIFHNICNFNLYSDKLKRS